MTLEQDVARVMRSDGQAAAIQLVNERADAGDAAALVMLGTWRLWGLYGPRDPAAGRNAIERAHAAGETDGSLALAALFNTGTGGERDPDAAVRIVRGLASRSRIAARQRDVLDASHSDAWAGALLRAEPQVRRIDALLTHEECDHLIEYGRTRVRASAVVDPQTGMRVPHPVRDSAGTSIPPTDEDVVVHAINRRIATVTNTRWEQGEPLHLLRYQPGQQYRPHLDALPGVSNQRILTVLVYLNSGYEGGETEFADGLRVRGDTGDAVAFSNTLPDGSVDRRTGHAGLPVLRGEKWLATRWIRAAAHDPWTR